MNDPQKELDDQQKKLNDDISISDFEVRFSTELKHKTCCRKDNISREEISQELSHEPASDMDFNKVYEKLKECSDYVLFVGQPKVGKSVLIKKFARFVSKKNHFDFIFFCDLRFQDYTKKVDLFDFLTTKNQKYFQWMNEDRIRNMVLSQLLDRKKILLILDDFDGSKLNKKSTYVNSFDKNTCEVFLTNILRGEILRNWKKIIVTRPFQLDKVYQIKQPQLVLNVLGFDSKSQKQILKKHEMSWPFDFPRISSDLQSFCFIPKIFNLLVKSKKQYLELNTTTTDIFSLLFLRFFKDLEKQYECTLSLKKLADFSWSQFSDQNELKLCFQDELCSKNKQSKLSTNFKKLYLGCFFITVPGSSLIGFGDFGYRFHFSHLLMQEFLLAVRVIMLPNKKFSEFINFAIDNEHFFMVVRFLFGFYNLQSNIQSYLENEFSESIANFELNKKDLRTLFQEKQMYCYLFSSKDHKLHQRYKIFEAEMSRDYSNTCISEKKCLFCTSGVKL